jgi:hypothetical protein
MRSSSREANEVLPEPVPPATPIRIDTMAEAKRTGHSLSTTDL